MNDKINAIKKYLEYFPYDDSAKSKLLLCKYVNIFDLKLNGSYYPRVEYETLRANNQIIIVDSYRLTNSKTKYNHDNGSPLVVWSESCGRLAFVSNEYYSDIDDEWENFIKVLKSYDPLDYDELNDTYIYNVENGKRLIHDYDNITKDLYQAIGNKIKQVQLKEKITKYEKLKAELGLEE